MASPGSILKLADPAKLLALEAARVVWIALDLLLSASHASNGESLSGLPGLGNSPVRIYCFAIDYCFAVASIVVKIAHALARYLSSSNKSRQEMGSCPDLGSQTIL
jgi:hypothetical protein